MSSSNGARWTALSSMAVVAVIVATQVQAQAPGGATPRFPRAVTAPPRWLGGELPFDVAAFLSAPPAGANAAPIYLDALSEFSAEVQRCFPPGPQTEARAQRARERSKRLLPLTETLSENPARVDRAALKAVLEEYRAGIQKLGQAQGKPKCVFETGMGLDAILPHVQASREVIRVLALRTLANLDRGTLDAAIVDVGGGLRLTRDLQVRGPTVTQLVHGALVQAILQDSVLPVLSDPRLTTAQCDRLIKELVQHESRALDGYVEALKSEYLHARFTLHDLAGRPGDPDRAAAGRARTEMLEVLNQITEVPAKGAAVAKPDLAKATPEEFQAAVAMVNAEFRRLLETARLGHAGRLAGASAPGAVAAGKSNPVLEAARQLSLDPTALQGLVRALARAEAMLHATTGLAAVQRWRIVHKSLPTDLAAACKEAGMSAVPTDPFAGAPIKLAMIEGEPVAYSVGWDGKDDGGRVDSKNVTQPGDLIARLGRGR